MWSAQNRQSKGKRHVLKIIEIIVIQFFYYLSSNMKFNKKIAILTCEHADKRTDFTLKIVNLVQLQYLLFIYKGLHFIILFDPYYKYSPVFFLRTSFVIESQQIL